MSITTIRAAWESAIWQHATVKQITDKILKYEHTEESASEQDKLFFNQRLNFIEVVTSRAVVAAQIGTRAYRCTYPVEVRYTLEKDLDGDNFAAVGDTINTLIGLVESQLGFSWSGTVDNYTHQEEPFAITQEVVAGVPAWRCVYRFYGTVEETL
jgi:hypothetical protein